MKLIDYFIKEKMYDHFNKDNKVLRVGDHYKVKLIAKNGAICERVYMLTAVYDTELRFENPEFRTEKLLIYCEDTSKVVLSKMNGEEIPWDGVALIKNDVKYSIDTLKLREGGVYRLSIKDDNRFKDTMIWIEDIDSYSCFHFLYQRRFANPRGYFDTFSYRDGLYISEIIKDPDNYELEPVFEYTNEGIVNKEELL
jgi:hypothetical protein